uniref:Uncharacterized protein n=1 Tax=Bubo bubo TaxID=30461 RepID=A0A8C0ELY8_BUBBB
AFGLPYLHLFYYHFLLLFIVWVHACLLQLGRVSISLSLEEGVSFGVMLLCQCSSKMSPSIFSVLHLVTYFSCHAQADDDQVLGFHQTFLLKSFQGAWVCTNEVFRLALHNV